MEKNSLTPEESFDIINKAIANFKMNYRESSKTFLLWGWILTFASLSNFIILKILHSMEVYRMMGWFILGNWAVFILIGFIFMFFMVRKMNREKKVTSHLDIFITQLWWVTAASFFIATFICIRMEINPPSIMLLLAGIATTTTGLVIKFKPLFLGGVTFFIFSIATTFVSDINSSLIVCLAVICGYLVPGYLLKSAKE
jgi:hypothetical protein